MTQEDELVVNLTEQITAQQELIEQLEFEISEARVKLESAEKSAAVFKADLEEASEREALIMNESSTHDAKHSEIIQSHQDKIKSLRTEADRSDR